MGLLGHFPPNVVAKCGTQIRDLKFDGDIVDDTTVHLRIPSNVDCGVIGDESARRKGDASRG